jgi:hypothetical protein
MFDDLTAHRALASLEPCDKETLERTRKLRPDVPRDYLEFLGVIGAGQIGDGRYVLYTGLVEPAGVFGGVPAELADILLFGDDMQGFCAGFDVNTWKVVEIDSIDMTAAVVACSFGAFIRKCLAR